MLKFYFNGSPNPTKVALFLEEAGIAYQPVAIDARNGEQFKPEYLAINPNAKVPAIDDDGVIVFDSNAILLYLAEKTGKFLPREHAGQSRAVAVLADVRGDRRRALLRTGGALQALRAEGPEPSTTPITAISSRRSATTPSSTITSPIANTWSATPTPSSTWRCGAGRGWSAFVMNEEAAAKYPNVKRLVDEISARPAAAKAIALKDNFKFKAEMDDEARSNMFRHLKVKVA